MSIAYLDTAITFFYNNQEFKTQNALNEHFASQNIVVKNSAPVIEKLVKDGYLIVNEITTVGKMYETKSYVYCISFEGLLFFENNSQNAPYLGQKRKERLKRMWVIAKIVMTILNSIAILYLMWKAIPSK